jgi:murein DD-endopeptidase MepM/ murein hydrolase activator NlpD
VYSIGDGTVLYAGSNTSSYVNVVLVRHDMGDGSHVCSFYGHLGSVSVATGAKVARGDQIATVLDWKKTFGASQSHLHYVILSAGLCDASAAAGGSLVCGYDNTSAATTAVDLATEPAVYTSSGDVCGDQRYPGAFASPSQFIEAHRAP